MERTLIILKPDALNRRLVGRIISRFEDKGFRIVAMKMMKISEELAEKHYTVHKDRPFYGRLVEFMTRDAVIPMVVEGPRAIDVSRRLLGATFGFEAEPGTIRGDFGSSKPYNLVHASDSPESAAYEIPLFFADDEIQDFVPIDEGWVWHEEDFE